MYDFTIHSPARPHFGAGPTWAWKAASASSSMPCDAQRKAVLRRAAYAPSSGKSELPGAFA